jgi:hypothetical protein
MMDCLDTLGTMVGVAIVLGVAAATLFRYGARIGVWFSQLAIENRTLYLAGIGLVCWTVIVGVVAWAVTFFVYVAYIGGQPDTAMGWTEAASLALLIASPVVALLAGIPWLVLIGLVRAVRALRELKALTPEGREQPLGAWLTGDPSPTDRLAQFAVRHLGTLEGQAAASEGDSTT